MLVENQVLRRVTESHDMPTVRRLITAYTFLLAEEIIARTGLDQCLAGGLKSDVGILKELGIKPYCLPALRWLLDFTSENGRGMAIQDSVDGRVYYGRMEREGVKRRILEADSGSEIPLRYFEEVAADYSGFFQGKKSTNEIVFAGARAEMWKYFFSNRFFGCRILNEVCGGMVLHLLEGRKRPFIMELGAGAGGTTEVLLRSFKMANNALGPGKFYYTDISPNFLKEGEKLVDSLKPPIDFETRIVDVNKPITEQGIEAGSLDILYSVNCIHVAKDLLKSLGYIRDSLKPGGVVVLCESLRPTGRKAVDVELIFSTLSTYTDVRTEPDLRPTHGFLPAVNWEKLLVAVGFKNVRVRTDVPTSGSQGRQEFFAVILGER